MKRDIALFVYGSLKSGFRHADVLADAERVGAASVSPYVLVRYGEYPAMASSNAGIVHGELVLVSSALLMVVDRFEECPNLYQREQIRLRDGRRAFAYVIDDARAKRCPRIAGGVWNE